MYFNSVKYLFLFVFVMVQGLTASNLSYALLGGQTANGNSLQNVLFIRHELATCSAVLIKPNWLLTAGHCVAPFIKDQHQQKSVQPYPITLGNYRERVNVTADRFLVAPYFQKYFLNGDWDMDFGDSIFIHTLVAMKMADVGLIHIQTPTKLPFDITEVDRAPSEQWPDVLNQWWSGYGFSAVEENQNEEIMPLQWDGRLRYGQATPFALGHLIKQIPWQDRWEPFLVSEDSFSCTRGFDGILMSRNAEELKNTAFEKLLADPFGGKMNRVWFFNKQSYASSESISPANRVSLTPGDSGGPLLVRKHNRWLVAGVNSFQVTVFQTETRQKINLQCASNISNQSQEKIISWLDQVTSTN